MVKLVCAIVGEKASAFPVTIDASELVGDLKDKIAEKQKYDLAASKLQLFLAKKGNGKWLADDDPAALQLEEGKVHRDIQTLIDGGKMKETWTIQDVLNINNMTQRRAPRSRQIHVLVVVPSRDVGGKRVRVDDWFVDEASSVQKKRRKLNDDEVNKFIRYFKMAGAPPLAHPKEKYMRIVERDAYTVIFTELMRHVRTMFEKESGANMLVTGNPGTGKSCFYLYCIFQLIARHQAEVKELGSFDLVLNFGNQFHKFHAEDREFILLNEADVLAIQNQRRVLRLIEGNHRHLLDGQACRFCLLLPDWMA